MRRGSERGGAEGDSLSVRDQMMEKYSQYMRPFLLGISINHCVCETVL